MSEVTMPARIIFQSWGKLQKPITEDDPFDPKSVQAGPEANALTSYAVITTEPFTISPSRRCARVQARAASGVNGWSHSTVPARLNYGFQAEDLEISSDFQFVVRKEDAPTPSLPEQVLSSGVLNGTPIEDIGNVVKIKNPL